MSLPSPHPLHWYLEGYVDSGKRAWRTVIRSLPLAIGRDRSAGLHLLSDRVSAEHAELFRRDGGLWVRDLASTNGTFVNGGRVEGEQRLRGGDLIRFADLEFRLAPYSFPDPVQDTRTRVLSRREIADFLEGQIEEFARLLERRAVRPLFQPVQRLSDGAVIGYELLSRGDLSGFVTAPAELFYMAERLGREVELSQLCRIQGLEAAKALPGSPILFLNTHPSEMEYGGALVRALAQVPVRPAGRLVVEIHEAAVTDLEGLAEVCSALREMGIGLAFDDFGTGQSRLMEIAEVPPNYVKFDMAFVRDLHEASARRRRLLGDLVRMTIGMGVTPIAEGVESRDEVEACRKVGFEYAQGYYLGVPLAVEELGGPVRGSEPT